MMAQACRSLGLWQRAPTSRSSSGRGVRVSPNPPSIFGSITCGGRPIQPCPNVEGGGIITRGGGGRWVPAPPPPIAMTAGRVGGGHLDGGHDIAEGELRRVDHLPERHGWGGGGTTIRGRDGIRRRRGRTPAMTFQNTPQYLKHGIAIWLMTGREVVGGPNPIPCSTAKAQAH